MKTILFYANFFIIGLLIGWNQFASAEQVGSGPSVHNPAGKPVPKLTPTVQLPRCEDVENPYLYAPGRACQTLDVGDKKTAVKIDFRRVSHMKNGVEYMGWATDSVAADPKIKNLQILDFNSDTKGMTLQRATQYCATRAARLLTNEELGLLANVGFFKIVKKSRFFTNINYEDINIMSSSATDNQKYLAWNLAAEKAQAFDSNKGSWNKKDGFNFAFCAVPTPTSEDKKRP